jgi:hypothetical protein
LAIEHLALRLGDCGRSIAQPNQRSYRKVNPVTGIFRWRLLLILAVCALLGIVQVGLRLNLLDNSRAEAAAPAVSEMIDDTPCITTKASRDYRVTLLGVTKGISFLDSEDRVTGDGRTFGKNAVPWVRVTVMIERPEKNDGLWRFDAQTVDDQKAVQSVKPAGITEMDLNFPPLAAAIFPTAIPEVDSPERAKVHLITLSGVSPESKLTTMRFEFGSEAQRQELIFENIPIP